MYKTQADAVKDWLKAYRANEERIDTQLDKIRTLKARMMSVGAQTLSDMPRGGGDTRDRMAEYVIQLEKLELSVQNDIDVQEQCRKTIIGLLLGLDVPEERKVIELRYLQGYEWNDVLENLYKADKYIGRKTEAYRRRMYRIHELALEKMAKRWGKKEESPAL